MKMRRKNTIRMLVLALLAVSMLSSSSSAAMSKTRLIASDGEIGDFLGTSVSISEDTMVVGAINDSRLKGSVYVFVRSGGVWEQQQKLAAIGGETGDLFGQSVSISGDTIVIGAERDDGKGSVYVFVRNSNGVWTEQQKLIASDGTAGDTFGTSVRIHRDTIHGDTIVVGAGRINDKGSAYVFVRNSNGIWTEQQKLTASDGAAGDYFGYSVGIHGDTIVVGAYLDDSNKGAAYVFVRNINGIWTEQQKLTASDGVAYDYFGASVSISDSTIVVGADGLPPGRAFVFIRSGNVWTEQLRLTERYNLDSVFFGYSVSIFGDTIAVGMPGDDFGIGSVYVFAPEGQPPPNLSVPEFPTVALPVIAVIGLMFVFQRRKGN
ncbi:MAG TPA: PEF-CTERM sorting domain-containing protein [Candidatus Methanoperedens sp.]